MIFLASNDFFSRILERNPFNIGMSSAYYLCDTGLNDKVKQIENTSQLACVSHSRNIMEASYAQCDWLHWVGAGSGIPK